MPKRKTKGKSFLRPIHFQAVLVLILYFAGSKLIFLRLVSNNSWYIYFFGPFFLGILETLVFIYLFGHEDFFHFIKDLEKKEEKPEKKYLKKYTNHGKALAAVIIGIIGGPIFLALTLRLLLNEFGYKYLIVLISVLVATLFSVGFAKGILILF